MEKQKRQQQQRQTASYSEVAKQPPTKNTTVRKPQPTRTGSSAPVQEPLIDLDSDRASSSDEAGNNKNPVPAKRARTTSKDAMDEDISPPISQAKTASSSTNFPQQPITAAPQNQFDQPPVDPTSKSSNSPYERPTNVDMLHQELAESNKELHNKENDQDPIDVSDHPDQN